MNQSRQKRKFFKINFYIDKKYYYRYYINAYL